MNKAASKTTRKKSPAKQLASESIAINRGNITVHVSIDAPYLSPEEYARRTGQSTTAVSQQAKLGKLPIRKRAEGETKVLINNALLFTEALAQEF